MSDINTIVGKYKGMQLISEDPNPTCVESAKENDKSRDVLGEVQTDEELLKSAVCTAVVDGESYFSCNAPSKCAANGEAQERFASSMAASEAPDGLKLCNNTYNYYRGPSEDKSQHSRRSGHAETSMLRELASKNLLSGKTLTLNISWITNKGDNVFNYPCTDCFNMLCDTAEDCGSTILLCAANNQTVDIKDACEKDKPGREKLPLSSKRKRPGYNELKKVMNYLAS